ncbi:MAG: DUF308 domain-containing protein [Candidatus Microthrix subdominans]|jgi:uncharacterized membrane protein HdeD (DUF308 family)|nr:DUF308 domain-containing protein [Candidatus Microthrix sp.]
MNATSTLSPDRPGSPGLQSITAGWWIPVVGGVIAIVFGFLVLSFNYTTLWAVTIAAGIGFMLTGLADLATAFDSKGSTRLLALVLGVLGVGAGIIAFVWPAATFAVIATLVAWLLLLRGIIGIVGAFESKSAGVDLWWFPLLLALLEIAVAIWAVRYPGRSVVLLVLWIGIAAISRGITLMLAGFTVRAVGKALPRG